MLLAHLVPGTASCRGPLAKGTAQSPPPTPDSPGAEAEADAIEGMDADGRIPKADLPDDLPNPDRWRYLPEGRIVPGNVFERLFVTTFVVPVFFFESDIGAGAGVSITDIDFRNKRRREFATINLTYTTEGQQLYSMVWRRWLDHRDVEGGGVIQEERSFVGASTGYGKTLTRRFFGIGPNTQAQAESSYTSEVTWVGLRYQRSFPNPGDDWVVGLGTRLESRDLEPGAVRSVPSTHVAFPRAFRRGDDLGSLWVSGSVRYDTRDSPSNPYRGWALGAWLSGTPLISRGDTGVVLGAFGTAAFPLPPLFHHGGDAYEENPPTDVLAVTAQVEDTAGDLPFWAQPSLGGSDRLRGYEANRWTDEALWFAALEYRIVTIPRGFAITDRIRAERIGVAAFYELGAVASGLAELESARVRDTVGLGVHLGLERHAQFRFDVGLSDEDLIFTATYGLSF